MIPCKDCLTLAICKAIIQDIYSDQKTIFIKMYDKPGSIILKNDVAEILQRQVLNTLKDKCSLIRDYVTVLSRDKIKAIEGFPIEEGNTINQYALQQLHEFFKLPTIIKPEEHSISIENISTYKKPNTNIKGAILKGTIIKGNIIT